jgi:hypothetical protein
VLCWACHRKCRHCYEARFRPYVHGELARVVSEAKAAVPKIAANLPDELSFLDRASPDPAAPGGLTRRPGRIVLAGGELLVDPVRESVLYPALDLLAEKWRGQGVKVIVQTTGDLVTPKVVGELLARGVWMISVAGMDDFHVGMEGARRLPLVARLEAMFRAAGMRDGAALDLTRATVADGPVWGMFGATEGSWIGKLWPRGRAWENGLSQATLEDNFCNAWSGGLNFLARGLSGSEVSVDPDGGVYPCCLKTKAALGYLTEERLEDILASLAGVPAFEAISAGAPARMGLAHGWSEAQFREACRTATPDGRAYENLCIGCDRFHEAVLGPEIARLRAERQAAREAAQ